MADIRVLVGRAAASLGYLELKPEQEEAVASFVRGADVFVSLPTGYGKSLCFGLLPRVFDLLRTPRMHVTDYVNREFLGANCIPLPQRVLTRP